MLVHASFDYERNIAHRALSNYKSGIGDDVQFFEPSPSDKTQKAWPYRVSISTDYADNPHAVVEPVKRKHVPNGARLFSR